MPNYRYTAKNLQNRLVKADRPARDEAHLYALLQDEQLVLLRCIEKKDESLRKRMPAKELADFARQMADMVDSGVPVIRAVSIMRERETKPRQKAVYALLKRNISGGMTLSESMEDADAVFPELMIRMFASGEASGQLEGAARKMAQHYDREHKLNAKIRQAMIYPTVLLVLVAGVVLLLFTLVLPQLFQLFDEMELPLITRIVMGVSDFLLHNWLYLLIGLLLAAALLRYALRQSAVRIRFDRLKLRLPVFGKLLRVIYTAQFARALSSLYSGGLNLLQCLKIASSIVGNRYVQSQLPPLIKAVREGSPLSKAVEAVQGFDPKLAATVYVGEETGRLPSMLESVSESFDFEAETASARLVALLEPVLIVVMALLVGSIMLSVMIPLSNLYQNVPGS